MKLQECLKLLTLNSNTYVRIELEDITIKTTFNHLIIKCKTGIIIKYINIRCVVLDDYLIIRYNDSMVRYNISKLSVTSNSIGFIFK